MEEGWRLTSGCVLVGQVGEAGNSEVDRDVRGQS